MEGWPGWSLKSRAPLTFLQAVATGQPLIAGSWFEYEDNDLDFNEHENYLVLWTPEIVPQIRSHATVDAAALVKHAAVLWSFPRGWQEDLLRSMERFTLSQCRHQLADQAVDLAIAFEIAMHGSGQGPMSWKAAVRSAQLIGGRLAQRQKIRADVEELFKFRNKGAHGGRMNASERTKNEKIRLKARAIFRTGLTSFLSLSGLPEWADLELEPRTRK